MADSGNFTLKAETLCMGATLKFQSSFRGQELKAYRMISYLDENGKLKIGQVSVFFKSTYFLLVECCG